MAMRAGTIKTMFFAGGLMALTNLLFALLAWTGKSELLFAIAVIADDITAALQLLLLLPLYLYWLTELIRQLNMLCLHL